MLAQLTAAVDLYNEGVAELDAGNPDGQAKVDQARAQIDAICSAAGFTDGGARPVRLELSRCRPPPIVGARRGAGRDAGSTLRRAARG